MFGSTMMLTVGQALDRAKDEGMVVRDATSSGEWVTGRVINSDGHGVAVLETSGDMCVVRQDAITCVRLPVPGQRSRRARPADRLRSTPSSARRQRRLQPSAQARRASAAVSAMSTIGAEGLLPLLRRGLLAGDDVVADRADRQRLAAVRRRQRVERAGLHLDREHAVLDHRLHQLRPR